MQIENSLVRGNNRCIPPPKNLYKTRSASQNFPALLNSLFYLSTTLWARDSTTTLPPNPNHKPNTSKDSRYQQKCANKWQQCGPAAITPLSWSVVEIGQTRSAVPLGAKPVAMEQRYAIHAGLNTRLSRTATWKPRSAMHVGIDTWLSRLAWKSLCMLRLGEYSCCFCITTIDKIGQMGYMFSPTLDHSQCEIQRIYIKSPLPTFPLPDVSLLKWFFALHLQ